MRVLVALGGNAMTGPDGNAAPEAQWHAIEAAMGHVAALVAAGHEVVLTHGNGPQVGNILVKNELAAHVVPPVPLDWCGAQTQGTIGYMVLCTLEAQLAQLGLDRPVAALVSRTVVDAGDAGFDAPSKPIGRYVSAEQARRLMDHDQTWEDRGERGWRRVVASPEPLEVLESGTLRTLLEAGYVVVAAGGGGIPVVRTADGRLRGVDAVIDKDLTAALLADSLGADVLVIATDVEHAVIGFGTPEARPLGAVSLAEMESLAAAGHFASGSMGPKVEAALRFVRAGGGRRSVITALDRILDAVTGNVGTIIESASAASTLDPGESIERAVGKEHSQQGTQSARNTVSKDIRKVSHVPEPIEVRKVPIHSVADASELTKLIDDGVLDASRVIAIIGKTEGNGGVNDYTRIIADRAFREALVAKGAPEDQVKQVPIVWSGGTDGVISPHATIFATVPADQAEQTDEPRLTVGFAMSAPILPEEIGYTGMITKVADAVQVAMERAGITDPADVHYVQTKTPLLTIHTIRDAKSRGEQVWTEHTHESMDLSNGTTGLGIAVALGEIEMPGDADVMHNRSLYSSVASCSSGVELDQAQVVVVGNAKGVGGRYRIGHSVMRDALDADGIWAAVKDAGLELPERPHWTDLEGRLVNVFLKCEVSQDGQVHGRRNAMLDDSDVHWHRQIKSAVGGVTAAVTGDPAVFVSVSAAHQGPDGGGPVAAIVDLGAGEPTGYRWTRDS